jgi:hypothetical protein
MQTLPHVASRFFKTFEDGLSDANPDVRLLATLCFGLASRTEHISSQHMLKIFALFQDSEDDVRETAVREMKAFSHQHTDLILQQRAAVEALSQDQNCHVQRAAAEAQHVLMMR